VKHPGKTYLRADEWEVRPVNTWEARELVNRLHYAGRASNTAVYLHGLFQAGQLFGWPWGVAWWIPPTKAAALATFPERWQGVLSLSRLVIVPEAPTNAASFLLSRSMQLIDRAVWPCLVTYADTGQGHTGAIYQAANWTYVGDTKPSAQWAMPDGSLVARKATKTRTDAQMVALGAHLVGYTVKRKFVHLEAAR